MYTIKETEAIAGRRFLKLIDPRSSSFLNFLEHFNPELHNIHNKESCSFCKNKSLVQNPNEPTDEIPARQITVLFYNSDDHSLVEKETMYSYEIKSHSTRQKILSALIQHRTFIPTRTLVTISRLTDIGSVSRTIQKMNKIFAKNFNTDQKLIAGKIGKGYRINSAIRIVSNKNNS